MGGVHKRCVWKVCMGGVCGRCGWEAWVGLTPLICMFNPVALRVQPVDLRVQAQCALAHTLSAADDCRRDTRGACVRMS